MVDLESVRKFYHNKVKVGIVKKCDQKYISERIKTILKDSENGRRFSTQVSAEGSVAVGVQVGKANELDFSIKILVPKEDIKLSNKPFKYEYEYDDKDSKEIDEESTAFVDAGKRYFPDEDHEDRQLIKTHEAPEIQNGFIAVSIGNNDYSRFQDCCIPARGRKWLLPYPLLWEFYQLVKNAVCGLDDVTLNKAATGPAITLTFKRNGRPNMSADITPKLILSRKTLSFRDFKWPRHATRKWLTKEKIDQVACQPIYLVPKGDKYWKISYANYENEILKDIDDNNTCRKRCLKIMKKKLMLWKKKSNTNFEGLSSYLLKTTLLWMCEKFPKDKDWSKGKLDNCYLNFLQEFAYRLRKKNIGEYFNPSVNLLENKDEDCIDELIEFVEEEITSSLGGSHC